MSYEVVITPEIRAAAAAAPMPSTEVLDRVAALLGRHLLQTSQHRESTDHLVHAKAA
jgi:hypothetical protein